MEVLDSVSSLFCLSLFAGLLTFLCRIDIELVIVVINLITFFSVLSIYCSNLITIRLLCLLGLSAWLDLTCIGVDN